MKKEVLELEKALEQENRRYGLAMISLDNREDLYCDRHEMSYEGEYRIPVVHTKSSRRDLTTDLHMLKMEHEAKKAEIRQKLITGEKIDILDDDWYDMSDEEKNKKMKKMGFKTEFPIIK